MLFIQALLDARKSYSTSFPLLGILSLIVFTLIIFICTASAFAAQATMSWDPNSESDLAGYKVHYGVSSGNYDTIVDAGNQTSYTISNLTNGNTYYFAATTYDLSGNESGYSAEVAYDVPLTDTTSPSTPTSLSATVISESQINISWDISTDDVGVTGYNVYRDATLITTTTSTSYQDTGLSQSTTYSYTVSAYDAAGNESEQSLSVLATTLSLTVNNPPSLDQIADVTVNEGDTISFSPTATDSDGDALTYSYSGWMTSASYTSGYGDAGTHSVTVTVSDGALSDTQDVTIVVNDVDTTPPSTPDNNQAPVLDPITDVTVNEGDTISFNPTATDPDGDALTYTYSGWMTSASYTTGNQDAGTYTVTITVSDGALTDSQAVTITVNSLNQAPVLDPIADVTVNEGDTISLNPTATDPDGDALAYTYSGWMTSASYTAGNQDAGTYTVTVTVSDGALTDSQAVTITVNNLNQAPVLDSIANITVNEGETVTISPTATDSDEDALTYTYSGWMTSESYTTVYGDAGTHTVTVTVSDGSLSATQDVTIVVNGGDTTPPSVPDNLLSTAISETQIDISWDITTDDVGVIGYSIYRDGSLVSTTTDTGYQDTGLSALTLYTYTVSAFDAEGNESAQSFAASATTLDAVLTQVTTVIHVGDTWKYFKGFSYPGTGWNDVSFDDLAWDEGPSGIGYGNGDDATILSDMRRNYLTVYARKTFEISDASTVTGMTLILDYDDGFVAYLNGQELARAHMPRGIPDYYTRARRHNAGTPRAFDLSSYTNYLISGTNVLSIEVHNSSIRSRNLSMIPELEIENLIGGGPGTIMEPSSTVTQESDGSLVLDIKANNSDGPITIGADEDISVEVSLSDAGYVGAECDWWVVVSTPSGVQYLDLDKGFVSDFTVIHQGVIFDLDSATIFNTSGLDAGTYIYYFGIDLDMNGELDMGEGAFYYDSVEVTVLE